MNLFKMSILDHDLTVIYSANYANRDDAIKGLLHYVFVHSADVDRISYMLVVDPKGAAAFEFRRPV